VTAEAAGPADPAKPDRKGKYTIQISTFKTQKSADRHLNQLAEKGYDGFVIPSGSMLQVCVQAFENKLSAKQGLRALQKSGIAPPDAYIRMIPG
jgi:cell division septation protein DedD